MSDPFFGVPPISLMQTGNQIVHEEQQPSDPIFSQDTPPEMSGIESLIPTDESMFKKEAFDPFQNQPTGFGTNNRTQKKNKYKILDLFWLLNPKYYDKNQTVLKHESHFVVISFNIIFNNMRVSFFNLTQNSIQGNIAYLNNMQRLVSGTIYPASAFNVVNNNPTMSTICLEQLWQQTNEEWQNNRPSCKIEKNANIIRLTIHDPKLGLYFYDFVGWQREAFLYACQYIYTTGTTLTAQNILSSDE